MGRHDDDDDDNDDDDNDADTTGGWIIVRSELKFRADYNSTPCGVVVVVVVGIVGIVGVRVHFKKWITF